MEYVEWFHRLEEWAGRGVPDERFARQLYTIGLLPYEVYAYLLNAGRPR